MRGLFVPSGAPDNLKQASAEGAGCLDGWGAGWMGDQKGPSILLNFKYMNQRGTDRSMLRFFMT